MFFSRSSWLRQVSCIAGRFFTIWATREATHNMSSVKYSMTSNSYLNLLSLTIAWLSLEDSAYPEILTSDDCFLCYITQTAWPWGRMKVTSLLPIAISGWGGNPLLKTNMQKYPQKSVLEETYAIWVRVIIQCCVARTCTRWEDDGRSQRKGAICNLHRDRPFAKPGLGKAAYINRVIS